MIYSKKILIKQHDITDCGAACLASVCAYYGLTYPIARIRQFAFTEKKGTNIWEYLFSKRKKESSKKLGLIGNLCKNEEFSSIYGRANLVCRSISKYQPHSHRNVFFPFKGW